jgi:hypothetical protein
MSVIVQEDKSDKYPPRTYFNAKSADITLALAIDMDTFGEKLTHKAAGEKYIGFLLDENTNGIEIGKKIIHFMQEKKAKSMNIAGNGIYTFAQKGYSQEHINSFVCDIVEYVHQNYGIEKIYTGGQTGVDLAGAISAEYLQIPALITLPKGYRQRLADGKDITQTREDVEKNIIYYAHLLKQEDINRLKRKM